jgi:hypothetical protein
MNGASNNSPSILEFSKNREEGHEIIRIRETASRAKATISG